MSEENSVLSSAQAEKQRNIANNANNIRAAADVASKTSNPYAKAIGTAVKTADKFSGGKSSEKLGKQLNTLNKMSGLKGRMMQAALNKMSESGATDKVSRAMNAKNGNAAGKSPKMGGSNGAASKNTMTKVKDKNDGESTDSATSVFSGDFKIVKYGMAGLAAFLPLIFCCLFISASQIYINSITLGTADSLTGAEVDKEINKKMKESPEDLDNEIKDEDLEGETAFNYDIYITDNKSQILKNSKLYNANIVQVADIFTFFRRKYNEATLDRIEEFFPAVVDESKNYDENMVYDFYFKMYNLYITYKNQYNVRLDLPLLMATLNLQSTDRNVVFSSNMDARYRTDYESDIPKDELDYYYDWSNYKISRNNSEHDMEILAQNMVSKQVKEKCVDSYSKVVKENILKDNQIGIQTLVCDQDQIYETEDLGLVKDEQKYKEFLKQFLEKKYYIEGEHSIEGVVIGPSGDSSNTTPSTGDFRNWTQCGQSWSDIKVPKSNSNMCQIGCLITSVTIQIARSGTAITTNSIDPGIAVRKYSFADGGNFYWGSTTNIAPNFVYKTDINLVGMSRKAIAQKLASYNPNKYYIVLAVSKKDRNKIHHYVAFDYVDTSTDKIFIMDPSGVDYSDLYERYKVYRAHIYEKKD